MVSIAKLAKKASVLSSLNSLRYQQLLDSSRPRPSSQEHPSQETPIGFVPVYVGEGRERTFIPIAFLSHPLFQMLLERAYREYGFDQSSGLMFPCNASSFHEVVRAVECFHGQFDLEKLVEELI